MAVSGHLKVLKGRIRMIFGCLCCGLKLLPKKVKKVGEDDVSSGCNSRGALLTAEVRQRQR